MKRLWEDEKVAAERMDDFERHRRNWTASHWRVDYLSQGLEAFLGLASFA